MDLTGKNNINNPTNPFGNKKGENVSPTPTPTPTRRRRLSPRTELRERSVIDSPPSSVILPPVGKLGGEANQGIQSKEILPAMKLHQQLESAGAYEKLKQFDPRRRRMLQSYLTTPKSAGVIGKEEGIQNPTQAHQLIRSTFDIAFFALPDEQRADYDNNPTVAWRISAAQKTHTKGETIKEALNEQRNPETGKIELSETHKQNIAAANQRRGEQIREGTYTGRPVGRPRKSENFSSNQLTTSGRRKLSGSQKPNLIDSLSNSDIREIMQKLEEAKQKKQPEDQTSE